MKITKAHYGMTIVEMMLALVILAMLMTAVAIAFDASVKNYQDNEALYKSVNTARAALMRITNDIRTAQAVAVIGAGGDPDNSQCSLNPASGGDITYRFDSGSGILYLVDNIASQNYVLCRNITAMAFDRPVDTPIRNVRITMTVTDDNGELPQSLAVGAVVRKNVQH